MEKQKVPQLNNDVYEKILEKVVELEVEDLNTFVSLRGTKWNCRNDCHGVQAFYAINVCIEWLLLSTARLQVPSRLWKNHDWPVECCSPLDKIINHTNVIYKPAVLRFSWIVPLVNFAMALNDTQREIFRKFEVSFYVDCHYTNTIDGCSLANSQYVYNR